MKFRDRKIVFLSHFPRGGNLLLLFPEATRDVGAFHCGLSNKKLSFHTSHWTAPESGQNIFWFLSHYPWFGFPLCLIVVPFFVGWSWKGLVIWFLSNHALVSSYLWRQTCLHSHLSHDSSSTHRFLVDAVGVGNDKLTLEASRLLGTAFGVPLLDSMIRMHTRKPRRRYSKRIQIS